MSRKRPQPPTVDDPALALLMPPVAAWFRATFGVPTPPQQLAWPSISAGKNTLLVAPTGSGKTLAAFLACLDHLWRTPQGPGKSVRILYISPLKALNNDIHRNLRLPLDGIVATEEAVKAGLRPLTMAVRTGDTPASERQKILRNPPDILITTPESLHLMLTSQARSVLGSISHLIVDEIHALCGDKRGVFLSLLVERLARLNPDGFVRIGLSATQRPLDEVARYLGGRSRDLAAASCPPTWTFRPVTILDAGQRKQLDLEISAPFDRAGPRPEGTIWPEIERRLLDWIQSHRSTIIFANNRRVVERLTAHLNEQAVELGREDRSSVAGEDDAEDRPTSVVARAHHGSLSQEERRATEQLLKDGELPCVVATASLEMGIDMGAVDLVCQVGSPGGVARGLQRVGRAGHVVGHMSKGRMIARTTADLIESAALARAMVEGAVETLRVPTNCLDVLAQQVVACVAVEPWSVPDLYQFIRQAYPYRDLSAEAFDGVLRMISGRFPVVNFRDLQPRISWDKVSNRLAALPGTSRLATMGGGTIADTGQYPIYLGEGGPRLGELDEEFVLERRVGETFTLGTATWKIDAIEAQKVVVSRAEGQSSLVPFWRGEKASRTVELGERVGAFCRQLGERVDDPDVISWLKDSYQLEANAAKVLLDHLTRQVRIAGVVPDDRTILVETFRDPAGELGLAILCPLGGKVNLALKLAIQGRMRERLGITPACLHADDGLLLRLPNVDEPPLDVFRGLTASHAERLIRSELAESALFGLRFRQNAGRSLLMPRPDPSKRTPLWLQRLRARDLLQVVRKLPDFPVVVETYRECLVDDLDLPRVKVLLDSIEEGSTRVATRSAQHPSPSTSDLVFRFTQAFLYEWDEPVRQPREGGDPVSVSLIDSLIEPDAVGRVEARLRGLGHPPRTVEEMAEALRKLGDLTDRELTGPMAGFVGSLSEQGRAIKVELSGTDEPIRWIGQEDKALYEAAFGGSGSTGRWPKADRIATSFGEISAEEALPAIVRRFLANHALVGLQELASRYPVGRLHASELLERFGEEGALVKVDLGEQGGPDLWADRANLDEVRRLSVAIRRRESVAVAPEVYADFLIRHQGVHPALRREGADAVEFALEQLAGYAASPDLWEGEILPRRVGDYRPSWLDDLLSSGRWAWRGGEAGRSGDLKVAIFPRDFSGRWPEADHDSMPIVDREVSILDYLKTRGASFAEDIGRDLGLGVSAVRAALGGLVVRSLVTNDRFDPIRPGSIGSTASLSPIDASARGRPRFGRHRPTFHRTTQGPAEGRWTALRLAEPTDSMEGSMQAWVSCLMDRHAVLARETVEVDPWGPAWRDLVPFLTRAEMRGEIRRGYFVEGLSGVQFTSSDLATALASFAGDGNRVGRGEAVLLCSLDPANLYGSGAPLDIPLLEGGTARLGRSVANYLVVIDGRPILIIEGFGRKLTGLASASEAELQRAIALIPGLAGPSRRVLKVETYNSASTLASPAVPWLAEAGFVRDPPGMAFYAGW